MRAFLIIPMEEKVKDLPGLVIEPINLFKYI